MGIPATLEEQKALAGIYCPDILEKLRKSENRNAARRYRRNKVRAGIPIKETLQSWILRMRKEIAQEMEVTISATEEAECVVE